MSEGRTYSKNRLSDKRLAEMVVLLECRDTKPPFHEIAAIIDELQSLRSQSLSTQQPMGEPVAWRWRFEEEYERWTVQKNKPHWYDPRQSDVVLEPLYAIHPNQESGE